MSKALLIDVDSTIPNLALMHISTWRRQEGFETGFNVKDPDEVWASVIFSWNRHKVDGLPYIMVNRRAMRTQRMTDLKRWTRPQIFFSTDYEGYSLAFKQTSQNFSKNRRV